MAARLRPLVRRPGRGAGGPSASAVVRSLAFGSKLGTKACGPIGLGGNVSSVCIIGAACSVRSLHCATVCRGARRLSARSAGRGGSLMISPAGWAGRPARAWRESGGSPAIPGRRGPAGPAARPRRRPAGHRRRGRRHRTDQQADQQPAGQRVLPLAHERQGLPVAADRLAWLAEPGVHETQRVPRHRPGRGVAGRGARLQGLPRRSRAPGRNSPGERGIPRGPPGPTPPRTGRRVCRNSARAARTCVTRLGPVALHAVRRPVDRCAQAWPDRSPARRK